MEIPGITDHIRIQDRRVEVRGGGGCLPIVGIMVVLLGFAPIIAVVFGGFSVDEPAVFVWGMIAAMCLLFTTLGAVLIFGRLRFDIDGNSRTYRRRLSVIVPIREKSGSLDEFDRVVLTREARGRSSSEGPSSTFTVYPIRLTNSGKRLKVREPQDLGQAKDQAEQIAKALGFALVDRTGPTEVVREADQLDESLRERRRRTGEDLGELPPPPEGMKTQFRIEGKEAVIEIPPGGFSTAALTPLWFAVGTIPLTLVMIGFIGLDEESDVFEIAMATVFALIGILLPIYICAHMFLRAVVEHYTVRVSPERLHVTTHGLLSSRVSEIPADELEELHIAKPEHAMSAQRRREVPKELEELLVAKPEHGEAPVKEAEIEARSDRTTVTFGRHLSPEEKEWVKAVLEQILTI